MSVSNDDREHIGSNRRLWDTWTPHHVDSDYYDVDGFKAGRETLDAVELQDVGDVAGRSLLQLQCHFGLDTLSWARHGAIVTGVDFSAEAVAVARDLARELAIPARFVESDVYEALEHLDGERFDVVFTSYGAISWLPDLQPWAEVVAGALRPGGIFFIAEHHPFLWVFDEEVSDRELRYAFGYFDRGVLRQESSGSYAAPGSGVASVMHSWQHTFEDLVSALTSAGLRVTSLREYAYLAFSWFPWMVEGEDGFWRMPEGMPDIPLMFSLMATTDGPTA